MTKARHVPVRTCIGCGMRDRQADLVRVVRGTDGVLRVDSARRAAGRGGYLHPRAACWVRFAQRKGSVRAWRAAVDRPARAVLVATLREQLGQ